VRTLAYSRIKKINGKEYWYISKNERVEGRKNPIQITIKFWGRVNDVNKPTKNDIDQAMKEYNEKKRKIQVENYDLSEQKKIQIAKPLLVSDLDRYNNRKPKQVVVSGNKGYATNERLAKTVLASAEYKCEIDHTHMTFLTEKGFLFTESHHLIPMAFQEDYLPKNLDREQNITSLCPTCHRAVHLGNKEEKKKKLKILFDKKKDKLTACDFIIGFDDLLGYYL
jgi:5-methylcytosine-specific restriction protein A